MRIAIYPGSFNPWHEGHDDILAKALQAFDMVVVLQMHNPIKDGSLSPPTLPKEHIYTLHGKDVAVMGFHGMLYDAVKQLNANAVVRGLRNGQDLEYEKAMQYWNEDLGMGCPTVCFITDRKLVHVSSSAIRALEKMKKEFKIEDSTDPV